MTNVCKQGHALTKENVWASKTGRRHCRECGKLRMRRHRGQSTKPLSHVVYFSAHPQDELVWVAGHFEGEGTVTVTTGGRKNYSRVMVCLTSTDQEVIRFFQDRWPCAYVRESTPKGNAKNAFTWRHTGPRALQFLEALQPFVRMQRVKRKVALAIEIQRSKVRGKWSKNLPGYREQQQNYIAQMRQLNRRGRNDH